MCAELYNKTVGRGLRGCAIPSLVALLGVLALGGCPSQETNFSQYPGFDAYFAAHAPSAEPPSARDRALLERFRPRFYLADGQPRPIDFYRDYIASGVLRRTGGQVLSTRVTRALLNRHRRDPGVEFVHRPRGALHEPVVYGRVERSVLFPHLDGPGSNHAFAVLTYHLVFAHSGLPHALAFWQRAPLGLIANLGDWHQLDHYTAVSVLLDPELHPVAVVLQQHNYQRTYLFGERIDVAGDARVRVDAAWRSNELYPHLEARQRRRAVRFLTPAAMRYLMGAGPRPWLAADDITQGEREIAYRLEFLPPSDAFYTFQGFLGERRTLPGRSGPPGARYNTLPELMPWPVQAFVGYWREDNAGDLERFERTIEANLDFAAFAREQAGVFRANWLCIRARKVGCVLR